MTIKQGLYTFPSIIVWALLLAFFHPAAMANSEFHCDRMQASPEQMHARMKARLDQLADRLEIKASQQNVWEEYAKSVTALADPGAKRPDDDADAATVSRYRAERAAELARKLAKIADGTAKLQSVLTEQQRKLFDRVTRHPFQGWHHGWNGNMGTDEE